MIISSNGFIALSDRLGIKFVMVHSLPGSRDSRQLCRPRNRCNARYAKHLQLNARTSKPPRKKIPATIKMLESNLSLMIFIPRARALVRSSRNLRISNGRARSNVLTGHTPHVCRSLSCNHSLWQRALPNFEKWPFDKGDPNNQSF